MREALVIAKREFLERVRTKWFVAMTILGPVLMIALIVVPVLLASRGTEGAKIDIVDETGVLGEKLVTAFKTKSGQGWVGTVVAPTTTDKELRDHIAKKQIAGFLRMPKDALTGGEPVYQGDNATNQIVQATMQFVVNRVIVGERLEQKLNQTPDQVELLLTDTRVKTLHTNGESEGENGGAMFAVGYIIALLLYFVITLYGINVMRSVVTEKSSRVVELMVAATTPRSMMVGKIAGVGGAGLAQISIWLIVAGLGLAFHDQLLGLFGVSAGGMLPQLGADAFLVIFAFFVFGFLFYSTM
ncbi:MAG TPA: ABC transporter permease, partial [Kofleriaceae bacterium]